MSNGRPAPMPGGRGEPPLVLTVRGRRVVLVLALAVIVLLALAIRAAFADDTSSSKGADKANQTTSAAKAAGGGAPSAASTSSGSASGTPAAKPSSTPRVSSTTSDGVRRSGLVGTGKFTTSTVALPAAKKTPNLRTFVVKVEGGVGAEANQVVRQVHATLNDPRGWIGYQGVSFASVAKESDADFVIHLASPPTTNKMCAPLKVGGKWSCASRSKVVLNSDRWLLLTPTFDDVADYRAYMVNHEVGHYLGRGHVGCPKKGAPAPVMLQQSISLNGCAPNAWPRTPSGTS